MYAGCEALMMIDENSYSVRGALVRSGHRNRLLVPGDHAPSCLIAALRVGPRLTWAGLSTLKIRLG